MDTRQLAAFCAVVERRSFSQAAERLGVTQPAVSLQVRALEKRLGTQLLDRSGRRVEPTEAGWRLYRGAQRMLALEDQLRVEADGVGVVFHMLSALTELGRMGMTVIGSTANIIAVGVLEKRGHGTVRFGEWFKIGLIVSIVSMAIATALLAAQTRGFSTPLLPPPAEAARVSH